MLYVQIKTPLIPLKLLGSKAASYLTDLQDLINIWKAERIIPILNPGQLVKVYIAYLCSRAKYKKLERASEPEIVGVFEICDGDWVSRYNDEVYS